MDLANGVLDHFVGGTAQCLAHVEARRCYAHLRLDFILIGIVEHVGSSAHSLLEQVARKLIVRVTIGRGSHG